MIVEPIWQSHITDIERREISPGKPSLLPDHPDALVIGGGLIGLWIAYFLAKKQAGRVLVVEQGELAAGSSRANGGGVFAGQQRAEFPPAFRELGLASRELYAEIAAEDWADFDWSRNGSLAIDPTEFPCSMREYAQQECELSRVVKHLTAGELRALEPALADHVAEGIYYPDDAVVNPLRVALSLIRILRSMNVTLATGVRVTGFETRSRRILRVTTTAEDLHPGVVVLTTGWSADQLTEKLDVRVPVQPAKGQMLASPPLNWRLNTNLLGTQLLRQLPTGELITGGTVEFLGEDYEPSEANTDSIAARARHVLPALQDVPFVQVWCGLRPHTPDEMPIIDQIHDSAFLAAGHFTKGVLLAPITGQLVGEWIDQGRPPANTEHLRLDRFNRKSTG